MPVIVQRTAHQVSTELDREVVALHTETNTFFTMNEVATRIWQLIAQPTSVDVVVDVLLGEYDVDRPTCEREVSAVLDLLASKDLVTISDERAT